MPEQVPPPDIVALADERALARAERAFERADELKARIESAGWRLVDDGVSFTLEPARPSDSVHDGVTVYGALGSVPIRPTDPAVAASVVITAGDARAGEALSALRQHLTHGIEVILVTSHELDSDGPADIVVRTRGEWSAGDAVEAGLRSAGGRVVVVLDTSVVPTGEVVGPLVAALTDPEVAIAGSRGLGSDDLHRFAVTDAERPVTIGAGCYGLRREEALACGPVDGRLQLGESVAAWLGLALRDRGPDEPPRIAALVDLPLTPLPRSDHPAADARVARRDAYRISDRFRSRPWLANQPASGPPATTSARRTSTGSEPPRGR